ncbi:MAG: AMP-binding protein [candidate division KSB1 bacterium]|nr:AMP-binding protein [candidate division KSB1 bacterium]
MAHTLTSLVQNAARRSSESTALVFNEHKIEYGRLEEAVRRLANGLKGLGVGPGVRVALMLPNLPHFVISYYAVLWAGATVVPLSILVRREELSQILGETNAQVFIAWGGFKNTVLAAVEEWGQPVKLVFLAERIPVDSQSLTHLIAQSTAEGEPVSVAEDDTAVIAYTAGTTGPPLGVELTHLNLTSAANMCRTMLRLTAKDRIMAVLPLFHPFAQAAAMNAAMEAGAQLVIHHRFRPREILTSIAQNQVTCMAAAPGMLQALLDTAQEGDDLSSLKYCLTSGSPLAEELRQRFEERFANTLVLAGYGLTEAAGLVTSNRLDRERKPGSVGLPMLGVELNVVDTEGKPLRPGQHGEIVVKGPNVMKGYLNREEDTSRALRDGWLHTGDIGFADPDHYFYVIARKKEIICKGGFHIYPHEIEQVALSHPAVAEAAAVGVPDPVHGQEVKLHVALKPGAELTAEELSAFCAEHLEVYKRPKSVQFHQALPKTPTGRILRLQLAAATNK